MSIRYNLIADPFSPLLCGAAPRGREDRTVGSPPGGRQLAPLADEVAHLFAFGLERAFVGGFWWNLSGDAFDDLDAGLLEGYDLCRIIGDKAD